MAVFNQFNILLPEIFLLSAACVVLLIDLFLEQNQRRVTYFLTQGSLLICFLLVLGGTANSVDTLFDGAFVLDPMSSLLKACILVVTFAVFVYSESYLQARDIYRGEFFVLGLFACLGMMIMTSAHHMLSIYLGLELLSLSLYAMVAFYRDSAAASESAMKYFVLGALASGMLLYGISILYGVTGSLNIDVIHDYLSWHRDEQGALLALIFIVVAVAFKLGAVPFHMWVPDVYQGAPTAVTLYIASAPKIAGFALLMRLLVDGMGSMQPEWQQMLIVFVVLSLVIGNVVAIAQTNLKRMLAYSTIAHVGFLLLGILTGTQAGYSASMFYVIVYALTSLGAFGVMIFLSRQGFEADTLDDLKGLNQRSPWFAFMMLIVLFSLAGVPPTVGFYAKLAVIRQLVDVDLIWLAVVAVAFSIIGAFYYLRAVKYIYFDDPVSNEALPKMLGMRTVLSLNGLALLALGIYPTALMTLCADVIRW